MNTISHFLMLFFLSTPGVLPTATMLDNPVLSVQIEFGRGPHCDGRGTCSIDETDAENANAVFFFDDLGRLHLEMEKNAFPKAKFEQQFENYFFQVPDDFFIQKELMQKLQRDTTYRVKSGAYPMSQDSSLAVVIFQ